MLLLFSFGWWIDCLVGGFNPFEKYARQNGNLPQVGVKIKTCLKPPPSCGCSWWFFLTHVLLETRWWICFGELWVQNSVFFVGFNIDSQILPRWNRWFFKFQLTIKPYIGETTKEWPQRFVKIHHLWFSMIVPWPWPSSFPKPPNLKLTFCLKESYPDNFHPRANHGVTGTRRFFYMFLLRQLSGPVLKHGLYLDVPGS